MTPTLSKMKMSMTMTKLINQIDLSSLGLTYLDGTPNFEVTDSLPIIRVTGEIMLYSDKDKIFMGDFAAKNLLSGRDYFSYWLKMPDEIYPDLAYIRGKNYDTVTSNSPIAFVLKAIKADKTNSIKFIYSIDLLNNLDR